MTWNLHFLSIGSREHHWMWDIEVQGILQQLLSRLSICVVLAFGSLCMIRFHWSGPLKVKGPFYYYLEFNVTQWFRVPVPIKERLTRKTLVSLSNIYWTDAKRDIKKRKPGTEAWSRKAAWNSVCVVVPAFGMLPSLGLGFLTRSWYHFHTAVLGVRLFLFPWSARIKSFEASLQGASLCVSSTLCHCKGLFSLTGYLTWGGMCGCGICLYLAYKYL